jgi:cytochrome c oxidase subunit 1
LMRIQLAVPNNSFVSPQVFNRLFTMHGTTMVFSSACPFCSALATTLYP